MFQCYHHVARGNETFDVLSHHFKQNAAGLHLELYKWMNRTFNMFQKWDGTFLAKRN